MKVSKNDWDIYEMSDNNYDFYLNRELTDSEFELIEMGFKPKEMEDKWFVYYEGGELHIHRSWTGVCIFVCKIEYIESKYIASKVTVNKDYNQDGLEFDRRLINDLINGLIRYNKNNIN